MCRKSALPSTSEGIFLSGLGYIAIKHSVLASQPWWEGAASKAVLTIAKLQTFQLEALVFYASGDDGKVTELLCYLLQSRSVKIVCCSLLL